MDDPDELARRLEAFEARLLRVEGRLGMLPRSVPPPPPPQALHAGPPPVVAGAPRFDFQPRAKATPVAAEDTEYQLGGRLLPWAGALVTILAIGYGVNLAFQHGIVTPWMIFWGGVILCAAFIVVGQAKRDEREEFGQLLTGIGSCGLYLTFAAGHLAQNLYEGETLVALFTALSLVNLAYSSWRASQAFFYIGVLGGFAGALMPLNEGKVVLHLGLHALILVPAALIVIRQNWFREACVLFILALVVLLPSQGMGHPGWWMVLSIEGTALLAAYAYGRTHVANAWDPQCVLAPVLLLGAAALAILARGGLSGTAHIVAFGVLLVAMSRTLGGKPIAQPVLLAGAMIPFVVGPWGAEHALRPYVFAILTVLLAAVTREKWDRAASALSGTVFLLGLFAFLDLSAQDLSNWTVEVSVLGALLVGGTAATAALIRAWKQPETVSLLGSIVLTPILVRIVLLGMSRQVDGMQEITGALWGLAIVTAVLAGLSLLTRWRAPAALGALVAALALVTYALAVGEAPAPFAWDLGLVAALALGTAACALAGWGIAEGNRPSIVAVAGVALGCLLWRFATVALSESSLAFAPPFAGVLAGAIASAAITAVGRWKGWVTLVAPMWILWTLGGAIALDGRPMGSALAEGLAMAALVVAGTWGAATFDPLLKDEGRVAGRFGAAVLVSMPFSRCIVILLTLPAVGMPPVPAITAAWTVYAAVLLVIGFSRRTREVRYVGLAAIAAAAVKLVLVDLANSQDLVRFLVTLGLGVAMIGGGYLYIRLQDRLGESGG